MRWLRFFSKLAFVCNLCFLLAALLQWNAFIQSEPVVSTIIIIGYFLAVFICSPLLVIFYAVQLLRRADLFLAVPRWLVVTNVAFFVIQILFIIFFLNDTIYN